MSNGNRVHRKDMSMFACKAAKSIYQVNEHVYRCHLEQRKCETIVQNRTYIRAGVNPIEALAR